jgi:D-glycero-alpha-D-manno-heptose 1-phosphate guanylyltransferase
LKPQAKSELSTEKVSGDPPVLLLVGGMGTRLRPVLSDKPKPLAPIGEISFLELLVLQVRSQGLRNLVMCTGFEADQIHREFDAGQKWDVNIKYSREARPLGTAGAIKLAEHFLQESGDFVVMNGDSFLEIDLRKLIRFHREQGGLATIAVRHVSDAARYGTVQIDAQSRVTRFSEKMGIAAAGLINGGVYVFNREVLNHIPEGPASLEKDVLPTASNQGIFALEQNGMFIDIGTPEDYARAQALHHSLAQAAISDSAGTR